MNALLRLLLCKIILNIMNSGRSTESLLNFAMAGNIPLPMIKYIVNNGVVAQYVADKDELSFLYWHSNKGGIVKTDLEWVKRFLKVFPNIKEREITVENSFESEQPDSKTLHSLIKKVKFGVPTIITGIDGCYIKENSEYHNKIEPFLVNYTNTKYGWLVYGYERKNNTFIHQLYKPDNPCPQTCALWQKLVRKCFSRVTKHEQPGKQRFVFDVLASRVIKRATPLVFLR
uniref:Mobile element protein n=1 Tax=Panagrellus redivivus TaxID=6233 RepID=A0A7E4WA60_PANRE